ncbi:MAG: rod shape-determining protein MreC [Alphaproteobacteria bacterium]|nr:rod shape-determining protein MreC [Alphaproteobacteria bacterium]
MFSDQPQKTVLKSMPLKTTTVQIMPVVVLRAAPAVLILLALTLMMLHRADTLPVERLRTAMTDALTPALTAVSAPFNALVEQIDGVTTIRDLKAENIRLEEENAKLQQWYESALKLQAENQSFRELLNVKADPTLNFITARVISDAGGSFVKSVLLPVGVLDKVQKGNAVMSGHGLVGRVTEVGQRSSRVLLITDLNSRIPVLIQNTRTKAILAGKNQNLLKLERLPPDSGMTIGARIVTSGDGGQLPADLPVGTIVSTGENGVWVRPVSDIDRLSYVQVVNTDIDQALATGEITPPPKPAIYKSGK